MRQRNLDVYRAALVFPLHCFQRCPAPWLWAAASGTRWERHDKHMVWKGGEMAQYGIVNKASAGRGRLGPDTGDATLVELQQIEVFFTITIGL